MNNDLKEFGSLRFEIEVRKREAGATTFGKRTAKIRKERGKALETPKNCHGCKWLDENNKGPRGSGYCAMVERSEGYMKGDKVRWPDKPPCELYKAGDWKTRWRTEEAVEQP